MTRCWASVSSETELTGFPPGAMSTPGRRWCQPRQRQGADPGGAGGLTWCSLEVDGAQRAAGSENLKDVERLPGPAVDEATRSAVEAFKQRAQELYGDRLHQVLLFGSQARGEATDASDVDLMVVLEGPVDRFEEIDRMGELTWQIDMEHEVLLSVVPVAKPDFEQGNSPLLRNVRREGVPA
ncbi:hypothetical protein BRD56_00550 [Thermoplasmatales archaeon SW_10_69_26]|nr:MAG: hypothetical protein BRD56_00550 [Thermoplasmatales archaeon SW_10_69_26]